MPAGEYVDIAFTMTNPGTWMLHCHILDHEDGGMMTSIVAKYDFPYGCQELFRTRIRQ